MKKIKFLKSENVFTKWASANLLGIFLMNLILMLLLLLYTAGYFHPFFPLTINFIVLVSLVLAILLLQINSRVIFIISCFFWVFSAFLQFSRIDIWAERSAIYAFEGLLVGGILLVIESLKDN